MGNFTLTKKESLNHCFEYKHVPNTSQDTPTLRSHFCLSEAQTELHLLHLICQLGSYVKSAIIQVQTKSHTFREMSSYLSYFEGIHAFIHHPLPINKYILNTYFPPGTVLGSVAKRQRVARRQGIMTQENKCHGKRRTGYHGNSQVSLSVEQLTAHSFLKISYLTVSCPRPNTIYIPGYYQTTADLLVLRN